MNKAIFRMRKNVQIQVSGGNVYVTQKILSTREIVYATQQILSTGETVYATQQILSTGEMCILHTKF